jgi:hypothetical protein
MAPFVSQPMIAGFAWLALLSSASAELVPSFSLDYSLANATHIVVIDAEARVVECWRGTLAPGEKIDGAPVGRPENVVNPFPRDAREPAVLAVTGNRRVLFLARSKDGASWIAASEPEHDPRLATVWIEKAQCFAVYQFRNPGSGAQVLPLDLDEATLKARVTRDMEAIAGSATAAAASSDADLAGEWQVFLPAGSEHRVKLVHVEAKRYRLEPASLNFGGLYEADDHCLTSVDQDNSGTGKFVWRVRSRYLIALIEQTGSHGSGYTGAVLFRRRNKVNALIEDLGSDDSEIRLRAMDSLRELGPAAAPALPKLRQITAKSEADPEDFRRAYTSIAAAPEHVRAYWAMIHVEASLRGDADE